LGGERTRGKGKGRKDNRANRADKSLFGGEIVMKEEGDSG